MHGLGHWPFLHLNVWGFGNSCNSWEMVLKHVLLFQWFIASKCLPLQWRWTWETLVSLGFDQWGQCFYWIVFLLSRKSDELVAHQTLFILVKMRKCLFEHISANTDSVGYPADRVYGVLNSTHLGASFNQQTCFARSSQKLKRRKPCTTSLVSQGDGTLLNVYVLIEQSACRVLGSC